MLKGLPGAGKTTKAMEYQKAGYNVVCKDWIRYVLTDANTKVSERKVHSIYLDSIIASLLNGESVVADATNLHPNRLDEMSTIAEETGAKLKVEFLDVPVEVAIARDAKRAKDEVVGPRVIRGMYNDYLAKSGSG